MSGRCTQVSPECPISATSYGYAPNLAGCVLLCVIFGICTIFQLFFGLYHRAWTFTLALAGGCLLETLGYVGRIIMHYNVWNPNAVRLQICCLIIAPSFCAAGIYLSLKYICLYLGPEHSILKPKLYTWTFIGFDLFSIFIQAAGGGLAAAASNGDNNDLKMLSTGNHLIIAGIALQVVTMVICGVLAAIFMVRYKKHGTVSNAASLAYKYRFPNSVNHGRFKAFCYMLVFAYFAILIRCVYRIPELAGGWSGPLMRHEAEFMVLDGLMLVLACIAFTFFHPGIWFPPMTSRWRKSHALTNTNTVSQGSNGLVTTEEKSRTDGVA